MTQGIISHRSLTDTNDQCLWITVSLLHFLLQHIREKKGKRSFFVSKTLVFLSNRCIFNHQFSHDSTEISDWTRVLAFGRGHRDHIARLTLHTRRVTARRMLRYRPTAGLLETLALIWNLWWILIYFDLLHRIRPISALLDLCLSTPTYGKSLLSSVTRLLGNLGILHRNKGQNVNDATNDGLEWV